jgi:hypothetical protein
MDVAVFIGFAASGPINTPVPIQSVAEFVQVFGEDAPLAWDPARGEQVYAYLAPTVRAFLLNGGRRCWIVRVASIQDDSNSPPKVPPAQSNYFPLPGIAQMTNDGRVIPAFAQARSEGSWSDRLRVGTAVMAQPVAVDSFSFDSDSKEMDLILKNPNDVVVGDLWRLTFRDGQGQELYTVMCPVEAGSLQGNTDALLDDGPSGHARSVRVKMDHAVWFRPSWRITPPSNTGVIRMYTHNSVSLPIPAVVSQETEFAGSPPSPTPAWPTSGGEQTVELNVQMSRDDMPVLGSLVRADFDTQELWLLVQDINVSSDGGLSPSKTIQIVGRGAWRQKQPDLPLPTPVPTVEKLTFELWVRQGDIQSTRLANLGFVKGHPRFWGSLPTDRQLYQSTDQTPSQDASEQQRATVSGLWKEVVVPRYPLAGPDGTEKFFFPFEMAVVPRYFLGPQTMETTPLERDGLGCFTADLFLDDELRDTSLEDFNSQADFLRYLNDKPRRLTGIYSVLSIPTLSSDEPTLIAVPDAVHRGWEKTEPPQSPAPATPPLIFRPEWWHFSGCNPSPATITGPSDKPQWQNFLNCDIRPVERPLFLQEGGPDQTGSFTLSWSLIAAATYILEEAVTHDFSDAVLVYIGPAEHLTLYGRRPGVYYYRVRAQVGPNTSEWSVRESPIRVGLQDRWKLKPEEDRSETLLAVQRALLRMCAARGDLFAVLSLPKHYREDYAVAHVETLKSFSAGVGVVRPLGYGETRAFRHGALYHPWLIGRENRTAGEIREIPPDGAISGVFAYRALTRGAWVAPANEILQGVIALTPTMSSQQWGRWHDAQINLINQDPRGFLTLSSDTLGDDDDRPIHVRRLLMLLRRLALKLGATYVFEPHDDVFRRLVRRGFETMLDQMFVRGAFSGKSPDAAYQVVVGDALNTPQSVEQGRFVVEIRVAPSQPMTFITIRLVQTGDRGRVTEV